MEQVYEKADDVHVRATYVYVKTGENYAYADQETTVKINCAALKDIFEKGIIIIDAGIEYKAVSLKVDTGVATITYVKTDGTTPTTAVLGTIVSFDAA